MIYQGNRLNKLASLYSKMAEMTKVGVVHIFETKTIAVYEADACGVGHVTEDVIGDIKVCDGHSIYSRRLEYGYDIFTSH